MHTPTPRNPTIDLGHDQLAAFDATPGERLCVLYGAAWLTQEGEPGDSVLRPGDELPLRGGRILVAAIGSTRVQRGGAARPAGALQRWQRRLRPWIMRLQLGPVQPEPVA